MGGVGDGVASQIGRRHRGPKARSIDRSGLPGARRPRLDPSSGPGAAGSRPKGRVRVGAATDRVREFAADPGSDPVSEGARARPTSRSGQFGGRATASTSARALGGDADEYRRATQREELALAYILLLIKDCQLRSPSLDTDQADSAP